MGLVGSQTEAKNTAEQQKRAIRAKMVGKVRPLQVSHSSRRQHSTCGLGAAMCCASSDQYDSSPRQSLVISGSQLVTEREPSHIYTCEKLLHSCDLKEGDNLWTYSAERNSGCFPLLEKEVQLDRLGCWALSVALISCPPATSSRSRTEDVAGGDPAGFAASSAAASAWHHLDMFLCRRMTANPSSIQALARQGWMKVAPRAGNAQA